MKTDQKLFPVAGDVIIQNNYPAIQVATFTVCAPFWLAVFTCDHTVAIFRIKYKTTN